MSSFWRIELGPVSRPVVVSTVSEELARRVAEMFGAPAPEASERPGVLELIEGSVEDGISIGSDAPPTDDFAELIEQLDAAVDQAVADDPDRDFLLLHASAVEEPSGQALVFVGSSGAGKSTHASLFALDGCGFLGDECLAIALDSGQIVPWRRPLALRSDVVRWLDRHPERAGRAVVLATDRKRYLAAAELPAPAPTAPLPIGRFVWLDRRTEVEGEAESNQIFRMLLAACHCFESDGERAFPHLAALARDVPVVRLRATGELSGVEHVRELLT